MKKQIKICTQENETNEFLNTIDPSKIDDIKITTHKAYYRNEKIYNKYIMIIYNTYEKK